MDNLLDRLFEGEYSVAWEKPSQTYYKLLRTANIYNEQVEAMMGEEFADQYIYAYEAASKQLQKEAFRAGVRFGLQLRHELDEKSP